MLTNQFVLARSQPAGQFVPIPMFINLVMKTQENLYEHKNKLWVRIKKMDWVQMEPSWGQINLVGKVGVYKKSGKPSSLAILDG